MMLRVDEHWDAVKAAKAKDWLDADRQATLLAEDYRELRRSLAASSKALNSSRRRLLTRDQGWTRSGNFDE